MMACRRIVVLIPVHNGVPHLGPVLEGLAGQPVEVWVSDDGSTDGTSGLVERHGFRLISGARRGGKGAAVQRGLRALAAEPSGWPDWVLFMDGDGQHLAAEVPRFLEAMEAGVDIVQGSRMGMSRNIPAQRLRTNLMFKS